MNARRGMSSGSLPPKKRSDEWLTPPEILAALGGADSFDLDPCSPRIRPWPTAKVHLTIEDDGLASDWEGRVWLNPPYSQPALSSFTLKMAGHNCGSALVFARTETVWFREAVWEAASGVLFIDGRLHFHKQSGIRSKLNAGAPSVIASYGEADLEILSGADLEGQFVPLRWQRLIQANFENEKTWREVVLAAFEAAGGSAGMTLGDIYRVVVSDKKAASAPHYREKVRQTLQRGPFERVGDGVWKPAAAA